MPTCTIYGVAEAKGNHRAGFTRAGKPFIRESNRGVKTWETQIRTEAAALRLLMTPRPHGVHVHVAFVLPRPKSLAKKPRPHTTRPDLDKLVRAVLDACTGVVFEDDSQVCELRVAKRYADHGEPCHVLLDIRDHADAAHPPRYVGRGGNTLLLDTEAAHAGHSPDRLLS